MEEINQDFLKEIIEKTIESIESSRDDIYSMINTTKARLDSLKKELEEIKEKTLKVIDKVDELYRKDKLARNRLAKVSEDVKKFNEMDIKKAYEKAMEIREKYNKAKSKERELRKERTSIENRLIEMKNMLDSGENIMNQISVALNYLSHDNLNNLGNNSKEHIDMAINKLKAQEKERKRISREIHDGPAQSMANIVFKTEICKKSFEKDVEKGFEALNDLKKAVQKTLKDVRGIIYDLRPMSLDDIGLLPTIRKFVQKFEDKENIKVNKNIEEIKKPLDRFVELAIYRLIQEIFSNISKHSNAKQVKLSLSFGLKYMRLKIQDNGKGFNVEKRLEEIKKEGNHFGILGIKSRVEDLRGSIDIESKKNKGTTYIIKLPISKEVMINEIEKN